MRKSSAAPAAKANNNNNQNMDGEQWLPDRAPDEYTDEQLIETPLYKTLLEGISRNMGGATLPQDSMLPIARDALIRVWKRVTSTRCSEEILAVFDSLEAAGIEHSGKVTISFEEGEDGGRVGTFKLPSARKSRFGHKDYTALIGCGSSEEEETYQEAIKADIDLPDASFVVRKTSTKHPHKNGYYALVIDENPVEDYKLNDREVPFQARLYQFLDNDAATPVIQFPPASGDKTTLEVTDDVVEVKSMSDMMKTSSLNVAQTPAVVFDLAERLKNLGQEAEGDDDDDDEDAATALLNGDDED